MGKVFGDARVPALHQEIEETDQGVGAVQE